MYDCTVLLHISLHFTLIGHMICFIWSLVG